MSRGQNKLIGEFNPAILNLPINSFCHLDTALVLTSGDFHSIFTPPPSCLTPSLVALFQNSHMAPSLPYVHIHLPPSYQEDICDHQNVSVKLPCVCVCLLSGDLFIFSARVSSFFSYFCVIIITVIYMLNVTVSVNLFFYSFSQQHT